MSEPGTSKNGSDPPASKLDAGLQAAFGASDVRRSGHSVLDTVARLTGRAPKVLLRDDSSPGAASPVIDASARKDLPLTAGRGNYQLLGEIASGGMGAVMKAHDLDLGRDVALKVLHEKLASDPAILQRFVEEAQIGGQLQHPGIVPVYELGLMADDRPFFTMKLVKGRTLAALLRAR
ncbi:MAG: serine/threonine protein kinase, partial [Planctomycetota bacterium]